MGSKQVRSEWSPQAGRWGTELKAHHDLPRVTVEQLGYLGSAVTWSHVAGLVQSEHSSASSGTSMWPQLQTQGLGFTSWTGDNNRMPEYLGCVHCRECFYLKKNKKSVSLWDVKSQKDESFVETSPNFGFLPPLLGQCSLDFNILLVLKCSHGFWGHLALAQWVFSGCLGASQHTAPRCSLLLPHLTNHLQGLLKSRSASLPISQAVPPLHMLQVPSQSCPSPLKPGAFLADRTWAENTWVQVPRKMPPVKNDVRGRRFWSFPDGWW